MLSALQLGNDSTDAVPRHSRAYRILRELSRKDGQSRVLSGTVPTKSSALFVITLENHDNSGKLALFGPCAAKREAAA